jgi:hypothetical protein
LRFRDITVPALLLGLSLSAVSAETLRYAIEIPGHRPVTYELDFEVRYPGRIEVRADWSGQRSVSLKLIPPGQSYGTVLRSGPPPQSLTVDVGPDGEELGTWHLRVHSLSDRRAADGTLVIETPEPAPRRPVDPPEPPTADPPDPWLLPPELPERVPAASVTFLRAAERYRLAIVGESVSPPADVCHWQSDLMRYLDEQRRAVLDSSSSPGTDSTVDLLLDVVQAIDTVEEMRTSDDPLVAGPAPSDRALRDAWVRLRRTRIDPVEADLDEILRMVRRDYSSELEEESWPIRFVSCLTACERYFEQRTRLGDSRAANRALAESQWPRILAASEALAALADLRGGTPAERSE